MPGIDGFETCRRLKSKPKTSTIPILFMTALSDLDKLLQGFEEGAVDYLVKPARPPEVLARLEVQLKQLHNMQRAESVLNNSPYAALVLNKTGIITWLSTAGLRWLAEFYQLPPEEIQIGDKLSKPLVEWFKLQIQLQETDENNDFNRIVNDVHFSVKLQRQTHNNEYLLILEKHSNQWDIESVKNSLGLTLREAEILMWISRGKTNKEVGLILESSPRTVNKHLEHIFEKLGVATRAAAVSIVMQRTS
jgi:DNA-binding NarL/FixJ family response regulator